MTCKSHEANHRAFFPPLYTAFKMGESPTIIAIQNASTESGDVVSATTRDIPSGYPGKLSISTDFVPAFSPLRKTFHTRLLDVSATSTTHPSPRRHRWQNIDRLLKL